MKEPIQIGMGEMSTFVSALMMEHGLTEFTLSFEKYKELKLGEYCIQSWAERGDDPNIPVSVTVNVIAVKDLPPETFGLDEVLRQLGLGCQSGDDDGTDSEGGNQ